MDFEFWIILVFPKYKSWQVSEFLVIIDITIYSFACPLYNYLVNLFTCQLHKQLVYSSTCLLAHYTSNLSTRLLVNLSTSPPPYV